MLLLLFLVFIVVGGVGIGIVDVVGVSQLVHIRRSEPILGLRVVVGGIQEDVNFTTFPSHFVFLRH